jgi:hypothetical protein
MKKFLILGALVFTFSYAFSQHPLYEYYNGQVQKHFYTTNFNEHGNGGGGWRYEGVACRIFLRDHHQQGLVPLYRFYNQQTRDHCYTTRRDMPSNFVGYYFEIKVGYIFNYQAPGTTALYQYYNQTTGDHYYSTDRNQMGPGHPGVTYNSIVGYVFQK